MQIHGEIALHEPASACRVVGQIRRDAELLKYSSEIGAPGRVEGTLELVVRRCPYKIVYRSVGSEAVHIVAVIDSFPIWPEQRKDAAPTDNSQTL